MKRERERGREREREREREITEEEEEREGNVWIRVHKECHSFSNQLRQSWTNIIDSTD